MSRPGVTVIGFGRLLQTNGIFACFVSGVFFTHALREQEPWPQAQFNEAVARMLELPFFVLLGTAPLWAQWGRLGWRVAVFAVLVLLLRRLPVWLALRANLPSLQGRRQPWFAGWFGPIGIAAVFFALDWQDRSVFRTSGPT
jgi:NhaP-type Na+/H+ or K+/H+ antiporter